MPKKKKKRTGSEKNKNNKFYNVESLVHSIFFVPTRNSEDLALSMTQPGAWALTDWNLKQCFDPHNSDNDIYIVVPDTAGLPSWVSSTLIWTLHVDMPRGIIACRLKFSFFIISEKPSCVRVKHSQQYFPAFSVGFKYLHFLLLFVVRNDYK